MAAVRCNTCGKRAKDKVCLDCKKESEEIEKLTEKLTNWVIEQKADRVLVKLILEAVAEGL